MVKKTFLFGLLFLLLASALVSAVQPQNFIGDNGLQIEYPDFDVGKVSTELEFPFHVYSLQDGLAVNTDTTCTLHVYNGLGSHLFIGTQDTPVHVYDYEFVINNSIFNSVGMYRFLVYCACDSCGADNEALGGFVEHTFLITEDGTNPSNNWFSIVGMFALFLFAWLLLKITFSLDDEHMLLKVFFLISAVFLSVLSLNVALTVANTSFLSVALTNNFTSIYRWGLRIVYVFIAYVFVYYIWKLFQNKNFLHKFRK